MSRPADRSYPDLPRALARTIEDRTGASVAVEVTVHDRREFEPREERSGGAQSLQGSNDDGSFEGVALPTDRALGGVPAN